MKHKNAYYTVTPSCILEDLRLTSTARVVYGIVENLTHKTGVCFASNEYLLDALGFCAECTLQRALALLERCGYIKREIITEPGKQNERKITLTDDWKSKQKDRGGGRKNDTTVVAKMQPPLLYDEKQSIKRYFLTSRTRVNEMFDKLWDAYPKQRRGSKQQAYDSFVHLICADCIDPQDILDKLPEYINSQEVAELGMVQYLYRWLENRGFESEYKPAAPKEPKPDEKIVTMPIIGVQGCQVWTAHNLQFRNKNSTWTATLRRAMDEYFRINQINYGILYNIRTAGEMSDEMARVIYFLGNGGNIAAIEREFVHQWWRHDAYSQIRRGNSTVAEQSARWRKLCTEIGITEYSEYDPTDDFKHMDEFYNKMGWK